MIPEIAGHTPHICVLRQVKRILCARRTGRQAEHHLPPAAVDGAADQFDLAFGGIGIVRPELCHGDIVYFYKIDAPGGIELKQAVIIRLCAVLCRIDAVHVCVPATD